MKKYAKTPTIYQVEATECGATCLAMIFAYFGKYMSGEKMRVETGVSRDGCNAGNLMRAAKRHELECHGYHKKAGDLRNLQPPCILHWEYKHFVVFEGYKGNYAYINDPALGRRKLKEEELEAGFTGIVLTFKPTAEFQKSKRHNMWISYIRNRVFGQTTEVIKLFAVTMLSMAPIIMFSFFLQQLLDCDFGTETAEKFLIGLVAVVLLQAGIALYQSHLHSELQKKVILLSSYGFLNKLFGLPLEFFEQRYAGELMERAEENARTGEFISGDAFRLLLFCMESLVYAVILICINPLLAVIVFGFFAVETAGIKLLECMTFKPTQKLKQDYGRLAGIVFAGLRLTETIKTSGAEKAYADRLMLQNSKVDEIQKKLRRFQRISDTVSVLLKNLLRVILLVTGVWFISEGKISTGVFMMFFLITEAFLSPTKKILQLLQKIQTVKAEMQRTEDILSYGPDDGNQKKKERTTKLEGALELRNVSFGYNQWAPPVIKNISVRIGCGTSVAFVGSTGCGKTTIAKIISRLYEPWSGTVYFDGMEAGTVPRNILSASIATVSQSQTLFTGTVRENITMWNSNISETDMILAATDACIHEDILQKAEGYDFMLTEEASNLSGGQRQRLKIARALATNPTILVLDEATSALDALLEKKIMDNIKRRGCTCVVIAHRLSTVRDCDRIFVMDSGKIVQQGTHDELLTETGIYKKLNGIF